MGRDVLLMEFPQSLFRPLQFSADRGPKNVSLSGETTRYMALSYQWDTHQPSRNTCQRKCPLFSLCTDLDTIYIRLHKNAQDWTLSLTPQNTPHKLSHTRRHSHTLQPSRNPCQRKCPLFSLCTDLDTIYIRLHKATSLQEWISRKILGR